MANNPTDADDDVVIIPPDYKLKGKIGNMDLREVLTKETIQLAENYIKENAEGFVIESLKDVAALGRACRMMATQPVDERLYYVDIIRKMAFSIQSRAGTYGFELASEVAKSLRIYCNMGYRNDDEHLIPLTKHVEALSAIFSQRMLGMGGRMGTELLHNLSILVKKCTS